MNNDTARAGDRAPLPFGEQGLYALSNFSAFLLLWKGQTFLTSEHAFCWEMFDGSEHDDQFQVRSLRSAITKERSAQDAYQTAETWKKMRRPDWDDIKVDIMRDILRAKAQQHAYVKNELLKTGSRELVANCGDDALWGTGLDGAGENMLGKLWMEIRSELQSLRHA